MKNSLCYYVDIVVVDVVVVDAVVVLVDAELEQPCLGVHSPCLYVSHGQGLVELDKLKEERGYNNCFGLEAYLGQQELVEPWVVPVVDEDVDLHILDFAVYMEDVTLDVGGKAADNLGTAAVVDNVGHVGGVLELLGVGEHHN